MSDRKVRTAAVAAVLGAGLVLAGCGGAPAPLNVVILLADDLGWNDVGYHGSEIATPRIDRLAREGLALDRYYTAPICSPARAGLLTGRMPIRYGLQFAVIRPWSGRGLPAQERTLAEWLGAAGYQTAILGKWHLGHGREAQPRAQGFDFFYGHLNGFIDYFRHVHLDRRDWQRNGVSLDEEGYATALIGAEAVRWLQEERDPAHPFFLYVPFGAPHMPLQAPSEELERHVSIPDPARRIYAAMVTSLDAQVGRILDALEELGLARSTLVIFASDNGGNPGSGSNVPLRGHKARAFEGGIRVPALVRGPGLPRGASSRQRMRELDWLPTLAEALGIPAPRDPPLDGRSVWRALARGEVQPREPFVFGAETRGRTSFAVVGKRFKLVEQAAGPDRRVALFDLEADPGERRNLAGARPAEVARLRAALSAWLALEPADGLREKHVPPPGWSPPVDWAEPPGLPLAPAPGS